MRNQPSRLLATVAVILTIAAPRAHAQLAVPDGWSVFAVGRMLVAAGKPAPTGYRAGDYDTALPVIVWPMPMSYFDGQSPVAALRTTLKVTCASGADRTTNQSTFVAHGSGASIDYASVPKEDATMMQFVLTARSTKAFACAGAAGTARFTPPALLPTEALGTSRRFDDIIVWTATRMQRGASVPAARLGRAELARVMVCDQFRTTLNMAEEQGEFAPSARQRDRLDTLNEWTRHLVAAVMLEGPPARAAVDSLSAATFSLPDASRNAILGLKDTDDLTATDEGITRLIDRCATALFTIAQGL